MAVVALAWGGAAIGQVIDPTTTFNPNNTQADTFDRGGNVSVRERPRPDYQAIGIHAGGFMIYPKITTAVTYDDNIYALSSNRVGDTIFGVEPEIDVQSTWSRNALAGYVRDSQSWFSKYSREDVNQYGAGVNGKYEFGNTVFTGAVDYGRYALPRSAANSGQILSEHPIQYDYTAVYGELAHTFNRLRLSARADYQVYGYHNGETPTGTSVIETNLNHEVQTYTGKAEFALSPDTAFFVSGAYNDRTYDHLSYLPGSPPIAYSPNSDGYDIAGGFNFDLTHLMRGEVQLGYLDQQFRSPLFKPIRGLSAKGQIEWFPTQLTTVTVTGLRSVGDSGLVGSAGFLGSTGGLQIDHELLRNVILTANAAITQNKYYGISRTDNIWSAGLSGNWLLTRALGLTLAYTYANQDSTGADKGPNFGDNRVMLSAVIQY